MFRKFQLHKFTTLLVIMGIVFTAFTNTYAQADFVNGSRQSGGFNVPTTRTGLTTYRYTWKPQSVQFQSLANETNSEFASWTFAPSLPRGYIPQQPMGVSMDLCFFSSQQPYLLSSYTQSVEVVIHQFKYMPL